MKPKELKIQKNTHLYKHEHYYYHSCVYISWLQVLWFIEFMTCFRHFGNLSELKYAEDGKSYTPSGLCKNSQKHV